MEEIIEKAPDETVNGKKNSLILSIIGIVILIILGILFFTSRNKFINKGQTLSAESEKIFRLEDVATHNNKEDCWVAIEGEVYDITNFISKHPGGEIIVSACGTDATDKFNNRPISGTSHSSVARKMLQSLRLGSLSE